MDEVVPASLFQAPASVTEQSRIAHAGLVPGTSVQCVPKSIFDSNTVRFLISSFESFHTVT